VNPHRFEKWSDCVIEDWVLVGLVDVFAAQEVYEVARIHAIKSVEQHVKAILQVNQLALFHVHRMKCPLSEVIEYLKQVG
jgi:hypothetical protein